MMIALLSPLDYENSHSSDAQAPQHILERDVLHHPKKPAGLGGVNHAFGCRFLSPGDLGHAVGVGRHHPPRVGV